MRNGPIILPVKDDDEVIFSDKRLGPWDKNWELETVTVSGGEWVVYFCSNVVDGINADVEIIDSGPHRSVSLMKETHCSGDCAGKAERTSRKYGECDEDYLDRLCAKVEEDAIENASEDCDEGCECAGGTFTISSRSMKQKKSKIGGFTYCKYKCAGSYEGTCS